MIMPCNSSGPTDPASTKGWAVVDFDWSNWKGTGAADGWAKYGRLRPATKNFGRRGDRVFGVESCLNTVMLIVYVLATLLHAILVGGEDLLTFPVHTV